MSILFHFTLISLKLEYGLLTADLLNQNPTKKVMLLCKKILFSQVLQNGYLSRVLNTIIKPGFHYTTNAMTTTQKQNNFKVEQSSFNLVALFDSKLVVVVVVIGLMKTRLY